MANNQITFGVGFKVDESGLKNLRTQLESIQKLTVKDLTPQFGNQAAEQLAKTKQAATRVEQALNKAFNVRLNSLNITQFNKELQKSGYTSQTLAQSLAAAGVAGVRAFNDITAKSLTLNTSLKQTSGFLTKMGETLTNTIRWNLASSAVNGFTSAIRGAFSYVESLDRSLTSIRVVTGDSREEMARFAVEANNAAQALGRQTKEYTNAALTFYQQGLDDEQVRARTEAVLKAQNITNSGSEMADYLTAVWNGFKVSTENTVEYVDKLAAVADSSASDMSELAIAMSKVASTANNMGVTVDQLTAQIATIVATTRVAPETVGNALKTIYARINDIKSGSDEAEISLGQYTGRMKSLGINVLDMNGRLRDSGDVMTEIGEKWGTMTREQQIYLAQTMAGQRQMNNLVSLFDNWRTYTNMLNVSLNSTGTLEEKNARYLDSIEAHLKSFRAAVEGFQDSLINEDTVKGIYDLGTGFFNFAKNVVDAMGGMRGAALGLGTLLVTVLNQQIANGVANAIQGWKDWIDTTNTLAASTKFVEDRYKDLTLAIQEAEQKNNTGLASSLTYSSQQLISMRKELAEYEKLMTNEQRAQFNILLDEQKVHNDNLIVLKSELDLAQQYYTAWAKAQQDWGNTRVNPDLQIRTFDSKVAPGQSPLQIDTQNLDKVIDTLESLNFTIDDNVQSFDKLKKAAQKMAEESGSSISQLQRKYNDIIAKSQDTSIQLTPDEQEIVDVWGKLTAEADDYFDQLEELTAKNVFGPHNDQIQKIITNWKTAPGGLSAAFNQLERELGLTKEQLDHLLATTREADIRAQQFENNIRQTTNAFETLKVALQDQALGQAAAGLTRGLSQALFGISTLANLGNSFKQIKEGTISVGQGFLQMSRSILMGVPAVIGSIISIRTNWGNVVKIFADKMPVVLKQLDNLLTLQLDESKKTLLSTIVHKANEKALTAENIRKRENIILTQFESGAISEETALLEIDNLARAEHNRLLLGTLKIIGPYVAGVAAVVAALYIVYKAVNAQNEILKQLQKNLQDSQKAYADLKDRYEELKTAFDEYDGMVEATHQMQIGTIAWYDALDNVNDKVYELLTQYPELAKYIKEVNGQLEIEAEGREELLKLRQQEKTLSRRQVAANQISVNNQQQRVNASQIRQRSFFDGGGITTSDQVLNVARLLHQDVGLLTAFQSSNTIELQKYAADLHLASADQLSAILRQTDSITALSKTLSTTEQRNRNLTKAYLAEAYRENELFKNMSLEAQDAIFSIAAGSVNITTAAEKYSSDHVLNNYYADRMTYANAHADQNLTWKTTGVNQITGRLEGYLVDPNGNIISADAIQQWVDDGAALQDAEQKYQAVLVATQDKAIQKRFIDYFNGEVTRLNEIPYAALKEALESKSLSQYLNSDDILESYQNALDHLTDGMNKTAKNAFESLELSDDMSLAAQERIATFTQEFVNIFGTTAFQEIANNINDWQNFEQQLKEPLTIFTNIDDYIDKLLQGAQITEKTRVALLGYVAAKRQELGLYENYGDTYKAVTEYLGKITEVGSIVEEKDINKFEEWGINTKEYFRILADGTYRFIGNVEEFQDILNGVSLQPLRRKIEDQIIQAQIRNETFTDEQKINRLVEKGIWSANTGESYRQQLRQGGAEAWGAKGTIDALFANKISAEDLIDPELQEQLANSARNLKELNEDYAQGRINAQQYAQAVELVARREGVDAEEIDNLTQKYTLNAEQLDYVSDSLQNNEKQSRIVAATNEEVIEGIETLQSKWSDWGDALTEGNLRTEKGQNALQDLSDHFSDMFNTDVSTDFIAKHLTEIKRLAEGDISAIYDLQKALVEEDFSNLLLQTDDAEVQAQLQALEDQILAFDFSTLEIGASLNDLPFYESLKQLVAAGVIAADDANKILSNIGFVPKVDFIELPAENFTSSDEGGYTYEGEVPDPDDPTKTIPVSGQIETSAYQVSKTGTVRIPYIAKDANGLYNQAVYTNAGAEAATHPSKTGSKSGGGSKKKSPQQKFKAKIDPYHDVNIKLKDNEQTLKNLEKQQNKVYGGEALSNLLKQVEVLSKERDLLKEKFDINVRELHNQQEQLKGYGATFDALGRISNYESLLLSKQDQINRLIAQYNAMQEAGADDDALQAINDRISALKEEYSTVESLISEYDNASDQLQALYDEATDDLEKALDKVQAIFKLPIEVGLEIQTREKDWLEFKRDIIDRLKDDDFIGRVEVPLRNIDLIYNDAGTGMAQQLAPALQTALNELTIINAGGFSTLFGTDQTKARQMVEDLYKKSMDQLKDLYDQVEEVEKAYLDQIDAMTDAFDKQLEGYDRIADTIEEDLKIAELLNGEDNYKQFQKLYDQQKLNDQQRVDMRHLQLVVLREQLAAQEQVVRETGEGQEEYKRLQERVINAFQTLNDSIQQSIESASAAWENAMKAMRQQTDEAFFGDRYMFDQMWEYTDWHEDTYLDPLEKANKLLDLQLDFNKEINNANEKNRRNLINLRDKILERLQAQEHIRESDLEMAQRELDVAKAQMALEDARNNKTTMRLRRDSQGNYTYQYVADADNIADKLKDYRDAMEKYRQLALDTVKDIRKELYDAYDESQDKLYEFMEKYRNELDGQEKALRDWRAWMRSDEGKVTLIAEDLVRRLEAIRKSTSLELQGMDSAIGTEELLKQMGVDKASAFGQAITEMLESAGPNIWDTLINGNTDEVTQILEDKLLGIVDQFDGMYGSSIDRMATHPEETQAQLLEEMETAAALAQEYRDSLSTTQELSGTVFDDYAAGADQALIYNAQLIQDNAELAEGYSNLADTMRDKFVAALDELARHQPEIDALNATLEQTKNTLNSVDLSQYEDILALARQRIRDTAGLQYSDDSLAKRITTNSAAGLNSSMPTYDTRTPVNAQADTSAIQSANLQAAIENSQGQTEAVMQAINDSMNQQLQQLFNADQSALGGYDSNLAYNSLAERYNQYIVDQLANIDSSMLDKIAQASDFINQTTSGDNVINQDVHIDASFPNVQSAAEIERAFNNLVNLATQRANTNRRRNNG